MGEFSHPKLCFNCFVASRIHVGDDSKEYRVGFFCLGFEQAGRFNLGIEWLSLDLLLSMTLGGQYNYTSNVSVIRTKNLSND